MATFDGPLKVLVVDDEPLARRNLIVLLRRDPGIGAVVECGSGPEAIRAMHESRYDLAFLDVEMPECNGFDVLELLGAELPPAVIFVTAYEEYALRAFEAGALDYLLKPFDDARFVRALARAKDKIAHYASGPPQRLRRLAIRDRGELVFVDVADIDWIEAAGYYACVHAGAATRILRRSLADLERDLGGETFARIHRSIIVNLDHVRGLELHASGEYEVVLKSQKRLRVSRRFRKDLHDRLQTFVARIPPESGACGPPSG
jgi:two-component system LytT family response regulator